MASLAMGRLQRLLYEQLAVVSAVAFEDNREKPPSRVDTPVASFGGHSRHI